MPASKYTSFQYYLGGVGASSVAMGLQVVIFPWLVVGVLNEPADRVGLAQMVAMLPNLLLILVGGALSENRHLGTYLSKLYLLYAIPFVIMLVASVSGYLSYYMLLGFGATYGVITAFIQPARESLLAQVGGNNLQQSVARSTFVQFGAQSLGFLLVGLFDSIGLASLLVIQMIMFAISARLIKASQPAGTGLQSGRHKTGQGIWSGLQKVWKHPKLMSLMLVVSATGFIGFGAYLVAMPIMAREIYHASAIFYAGLQLCFAIGVLLANYAYMKLSRGFQRPGRVLLISLFSRAVIMIIIGNYVPARLLFPLVILWGMCSGISISLGRVMTHTEAPDSHRSRIVSIYQLALLGTAPIGAWLCGYLITIYGVLDVYILLGVMTMIAALLGGFSQLWKSPPEMPVVQR